MIYVSKKIKSFQEYIYLKNSYFPIIRHILVEIKKDNISSVVKLINNNQDLSEFIKDKALEYSFYKVNKNSSVDQICSIMGFIALKNLLYQYILYKYKLESWKLFRFTDNRFNMIMSYSNVVWVAILRHKYRTHFEKYMNLILFLPMLYISLDYIFSSSSDEIIIHEFIAGKLDINNLIKNHTDMQPKEFYKEIIYSFDMKPLIEQSEIIDLFTEFLNNDLNKNMVVKNMLQMIVLEMSNKTSLIRIDLSRFFNFNMSNINEENREIFKDIAEGADKVE